MHEYRRLRVWQVARQLALDVFQLSQAFPDSERFGITAQIRRSAVSIPSNIAEGAGRDGAAFRQFLSYAAGSASELDTQLDIALHLGLADDAIINDALLEVDAVRRMLWGLIDREAPSRDT